MDSGNRLTFAEAPGGELFGAITEKAEAFADGNHERLAAVCFAKLLSERGIPYDWHADNTFSARNWDITVAVAEDEAGPHTTVYWRRELSLAIFTGALIHSDSPSPLPMSQWLRAFPECWQKAQAA